MMRRWFGVALMAWAVLASLLVVSPAALAANETYSVDANGNIVGKGSVNATFTANGGNYVFNLNLGAAPNTCSVTYTISGVQKGTGTNYTGNIATAVVGQPANCTATQLNSAITIADPKGTQPGGGGAPAPATSPAPAAAATNTFDCSGGSLTWLICPVLQAGVDAIDWIRDNILIPFLQEQPLSTTNPGGGASPIYTVWSHFRDVASVFFILIFFLIVYGTAIGFDNYTVKKVLPHLIAGAILVPFSWYICVIGLDIGNVLGQGLVALCNSFIPAPAIDFTSNLSKLFLGTTAVLAGLALVTALTSFSFGLLFTILIAVLATLFTLVLRKILIILLVVLSPFAFLAWILPNTQKLFKQWWTNLARMILMYPLIMLVFEAGRLFATTAGSIFGTATTGVAAQGQNAVVPLMQIAGLYLPLMVVPFTFSWAGGAMKMGANAIGKAGSRLDARYGKNSASAKERREQTQKVNADRSLRSNNAAVRAFARKRAGLGGGFLSEVPGLNKVPGIKMSGHAKQKINSAAESYASAEALSEAQEEDLKSNRRTSKENIASKTLAASERIREARVAEASLAKLGEKGSVAVKDIDLKSDRSAESHKAIVDAKQKGDVQGHIEALMGSGGIDQLEGIYRNAVKNGDDATAIAASRRLSQSRGGFERMQQLANGKVVAVQDEKTGKVIDYKGGNGEDYEEVRKKVIDANGKEVTRVVGAVKTGSSFLGGSDTQVVADAHKDKWNSGTRDAKAFDQNKPLVAATADNAPGDLAAMDAYQAKRMLAYYSRHTKDPGDKLYAAASSAQRDFNEASEKIFESPSSKAAILPETARTIANSATGVVSPSAQAKFAERAGVQMAPPPGVVAPGVANAVYKATGGDIHYVAQVHAAMEANPTIVQNITTQLTEKSPDQVDLEITQTPLAAGESRIGAQLAQHIQQKLGNDFGRVSAVERRYATDPTYKAEVDNAFAFGREIPAP